MNNQSNTPGGDVLEPTPQTPPHTTDNKSGMFRFFIAQKTFSILFVVTLVLGGLMGYNAMVKESFPDLAIPQALVITEWPGASPEIIEKEVSTKIEKKLKSLKGLKVLRSGSRRNYSTVAVEFQADADMTESMALLRAKVNEAEADLPKEAEKPTIKEVSVTDTPIITFMIYGDTEQAMMGRVARELKKRFERINGIREVQLTGSRDEIIRVQLRPERLKALGLSAATVKQSIIDASKDMPLGRFESKRQAWELNLTARYDTVGDLKNIPVKRFNTGRTVRLHEVANVTRNLEKEVSRSFLSWEGDNYQRGIAIGLVKVSGRDTLGLIDRAIEVMEEGYADESWPVNLKYAIVSNESENILEQLNTILSNGWQAILCVFIVLFFMLTWREALVAGLSIPITFLGSVAVLAFMGYTVNTIVIVGMVLALGMLVDVFILVMEGMHEGIFSRGDDFLTSAKKTIKTYAMPAFAGQLTTILALAPLLAIKGMDGKFIRLMPITTIVCLLLSFVIAFIVSIPLSRWVLDVKGLKAGKTAMDKLTESISGKLEIWLLKGPLANKGKALLWVGGAFGAFILAIQLAGYLPSEMYPKDDGRDMGVLIRLAPGTDLEISQQLAEEVGAELQDIPYLTSTTMYVGKRSPFSGGGLQDSLTPEESSNYVGFSLRFTPKEERDKLAYEYVESLRSKIQSVLDKHPGTELFFKAATGGASGASPVQIEVSGPEMSVLRKLSHDVQTALETVPGAADATNNLGPAEGEIRLTPRREALNFYKVSLGDLIDQMRLAMDNDKATTFKMPGTEDDIDVKVGTEWPSRAGKMGGPRNMQEIMHVSIMDEDGKSIPLPSLLNFSMEESSQVILHRDSIRTVTVSSKTDGVTASQILDVLRPQLEEMKKDWPTGYNWKFGGEAENTAEVYSAVPMVLALALFLVFAVMALLFGSFAQPFIIMLTVPMGLTGTFIGFYLLEMPLSFPAIVGIISLAGIVVNNAIVMIQTMNTLRGQGLTVQQAAARGSAQRLRPIASTTITTLIGLVPLALSSPFWKPLCFAIIFGLGVATCLAVVVIPCLYKLFTKENAAA